jgi:hypothetical protein
MQRLEMVMQQSSFAAHMQRQVPPPTLSPPLTSADPPMPETVRSAPPTPARRPLRAPRGKSQYAFVAGCPGACLLPWGPPQWYAGLLVCDSQHARGGVSVCMMYGYVPDDVSVLFPSVGLAD